ncbi:hypothetical protein ACOTV5_06505 [Aliarcobacter butzleri]|uniref:hypothetical protein n=1 Tax=Aliarcobacter butzleri TaxID=28197 RepID=UPI003AFAEF67|nr:hypothetical protein [Aliarcobacter butzleri]
MRNIDRFNIKQFNRVYQNSKIIYQFSKYGKNGLSKVNPTLVFIDAIISLGELFVSYSNYCKVKEQNKQLEIEINTLTKEFNNFKKSLKLKEEKFKFELEQNGKLIEEILEKDRNNYKILQKAYSDSKSYLFKMKKEVEKYKKEFPYSKETQEIENKYDEVLTFYINTTLEVIGG